MIWSFIEPKPNILPVNERNITMIMENEAVYPERKHKLEKFQDKRLLSAEYIAAKFEYSKNSFGLYFISEEPILV
jgi:hypothetical protein